MKKHPSDKAIEDIHRFQNDARSNKDTTQLAGPRYDLDRFHLVQDVVDRVPNLGSKGAYLKRQMRDKLIEHKHFIDAHGQDMPEILNRKWDRLTK